MSGRRAVELAAIDAARNYARANGHPEERDVIMEAFFALGWVRLPDDAAIALLNDTTRAAELRAELLDIANEAGAIASRLGDLLEGTA